MWCLTIRYAFKWSWFGKKVSSKSQALPWLYFSEKSGHHDYTSTCILSGWYAFLLQLLNIGSDIHTTLCCKSFLLHVNTCFGLKSCFAYDVFFDTLILVDPSSLLLLKAEVQISLCLFVMTIEHLSRVKSFVIKYKVIE